MGASAIDQNGGAGGGAPGGDGGNGAPAGTGAAGDGNGGAGAGGAGGLNDERLSPILRGKSPEELNELVDTLVQTIATRRNGPAAPAAPKAPEPEPDYREFFDPSSDKFNPQAAVADIARRNFGGLIGDIAQRANEGVFANFRNEYPDFKEYEGDIRKLLRDNNSTNPSPEQINGLYFAAKGYKSTMKEKADRERLRTLPPTPRPEDTVVKDEPLDPAEEGVARRMFSHSQDPIKEYRDYVKRLDAGENSMKVPLSGGIKR